MLKALCISESKVPKKVRLLELVPKLRYCIANSIQKCQTIPIPAMKDWRWLQYVPGTASAGKISVWWCLQILDLHWLVYEIYLFHFTLFSLSNYHLSLKIGLQLLHLLSDVDVNTLELKLNVSTLSSKSLVHFKCSMLHCSVNTTKLKMCGSPEAKTNRVHHKLRIMLWLLSAKFWLSVTLCPFRVFNFFFWVEMLCSAWYSNTVSFCHGLSLAGVRAVQQQTNKICITSWPSSHDDAGRGSLCFCTSLVWLILTFAVFSFRIVCRCCWRSHDFPDLWVLTSPW